MNKKVQYETTTAVLNIRARTHILVTTNFRYEPRTIRNAKVNNNNIIEHYSESQRHTSQLGAEQQRANAYTTKNKKNNNRNIIIIMKSTKNAKHHTNSVR